MDKKFLPSDEQTAIFNWFSSGTGNLVVEALPGSGKTKTIEIGIEKMPEKTGLYCVFNKKNQLEAQAKIRDARVQILTHHASGFRCIKKHWPKSRPDNYVENDRIDAASTGLKPSVKSAIRRLVGYAKNTLISPTVEDLKDICLERDIDCNDFSFDLDKMAAVALKVLELSKIPDRQNRISFDDMVWLPVANNWVTPTYDLVVVDECQDMNAPQLMMAKGLSRGRICVVGDSNQAIYHFRGAASDGMQLMRKELNASDLSLTTTYRCAKAIVNYANQFLPNYKAAADAAEGTVDNVSHDSLITTAKPGNAILSRLNAPLMPLCLRFLRANIPAKIEGRDIGKALMGIVRETKAASVEDFLAKIEVWRNKMVSRVIKTRNGDRRAMEIDDQADTLIAVAEGVNSVRDIENRLENLFTDSTGEGNNLVILSSTHKAKGLEWDRVFLLKETYNRRPAVTEEGAREERNIWVVAITRAKTHLTFVGQ